MNKGGQHRLGVQCRAVVLAAVAVSGDGFLNDAIRAGAR